jgi:hypothetical protein
MTCDALAIYQEIKKGGYRKYDEEKHCPMLIRIMANANQGTIADFCCEAFIDEATFYRWVNKYDIFAFSYGLGKVMARRAWEKAGDELLYLGSEEVGCKFEVWRMRGWSRFGVGKNARIRLNLNPKSNPAEHYGQLLAQAAEGDFTAGEIKQLMEAINVGLNAHQVFELQKEIDDLKSDLAKLYEMQTNGDHSGAIKGT